MRFALVAGITLVVLLTLGCGKPKEAQRFPPALKPPREEPAPPVLVGLEKLAGYYDIVEVDGELGLAGYLRIVAGPTEIGYEARPLLGALNPAPTYTLLTPFAATTQREETDTWTQLHESEGQKVTVIYRRVGKRITVESEVCRPGICEPRVWVVATPE